MADSTFVWVKENVIEKASKAPKRKPPSDPKDPRWSWTRCMVLSGELSVSSGKSIGTLHVRVQDRESLYDTEKLALKGTSKGNIPLGSVVNANEWEYNESSGVPPDDLISLTHLHEPAVVSCLKKRYEADQIYTSTGPILLALNPFKALPGLYDDVMSAYWSSDGNTENMKPHVYGHAERAFQNMMANIQRRTFLGGSSSSTEGFMCDQSVLVSGESGAGKTVTAKHIMRYLATLSEKKAEHAKRRRAPSPGRGEGTAPRRSMLTRRMSRAQSWKAGAQIEERILESNPILEAFGNARTIRNDNSSRFGKFIELQFQQTGALIGAAIETYLLEKVRLVHPSQGERNFHIFYEMLAAATPDEREDFYLQDYTVEDFKMTNVSGTYDRRDGVSDSQLYDQLVVAMRTLGFGENMLDDIFRVTMAFLHASNLTFEAVTDDSSKVDETNPHLEPTLKLLGLQKDDFQAALCQFEIEAGNASYTRQVDKEHAATGLEALVKATYGSMFSFIVQTINKKIEYKPKPHVRKSSKAAFIGVLDIFGFESFNKNSFEQLCINYCNEALQQQFNKYIFKSEQAEYKREEIAWEFIEFPDNQDVIELIDRKGEGMIPLLTDQCVGTRGSDKKYADAVYKYCGKHKRFEANPLMMGKQQFIIHHYAGPVLYELEGFVEKNKDDFPRGAAALLESSTNEFVQLLGKISTPTTTQSSGRAGRRGRPTVGGQFASQLSQLRSRIEKTSPHYIRCLKPNQHLKPDLFNCAMIADQLRYAGVLEAIRVSRVGYSQRYKHRDFVKRYRFIATDALKKATDPTTALVQIIAKKIVQAENPNAAMPADLLVAAGIQMGVTKVFLRQHAFDYMERFRSQVLSKAAIKVQSAGRRFLQRCRYIRIRKCIIIGQACVRRFLARKHLRFMRERKASTLIQSNLRMGMVRRQYVQKKTIALWFQRMQRGKQGRKRFISLYNQRQEEIALNERQYKAAVTIQCMFRGVRAKQTVVSRRIAKQDSQKSFYGDSEAVKILKRQRQTAALQADRNAAIAKQTARERNLEVDTLKQRLQKAEINSEQQRTTREQLIVMQSENDQLKTDLATAMAEIAELKEKLANKSAEVKKLKKQVQNGGVAASPYTGTQYDDHPDLKQLDERLHVVTSTSKNGMRELEALVQSLAILR